MSLNDRDLIEAAYRLLLGRDPDEEGMRVHLNAKLSPEALARTFMRAPGFLKRQSATKTLSIYGNSFTVPAAETTYCDNYEPHVFHELMKRLHSGVTFLDLGANIGVFTVHAAKRGANVIAIEPRRDNVQFLLENARQNEVSAELHPLGASAEAGYATLQLAENSNAGIRRLQEGLGTEIIPIQRIDTIVGNRRVDVLKIDIEGHEYKAMLGAHQLLSAHRPSSLPSILLNFREPVQEWMAAHTSICFSATDTGCPFSMSTARKRSNQTR